MDVLDPVKLLNDRLDFVEIILLGRATADPSDLLHLGDRLDALSAAARNLESEIPHISIIRDLLLKLRPQICKSKSSLALTIERLETAFAMRRELEDTVDMLLTIEGTAQSANISASLDIAQYQLEFKKVEDLLRPLIVLSNEQSDEIDSFLSTYEIAVLRRTLIYDAFLKVSGVNSVDHLSFLPYFRWRFYRRNAVGCNQACKTTTRVAAAYSFCWLRFTLLTSSYLHNQLLC